MLESLLGWGFEYRLRSSIVSLFVMRQIRPIDQSRQSVY